MDWGGNAFVIGLRLVVAWPVLCSHWWLAAHGGVTILGTPWGTRHAVSSAG